jgi:hypothetical protein
MLPACWKNNGLEKSMIQIYTINGWLKWLVKMVIGILFALMQKPNRNSQAMSLHKEEILLQTISNIFQ